MSLLSESTAEDLIVRRVSVNRARTPQEAIEAIGRNKYCDDDIVDAMPHGTNEEAEIFFFKLNYDVPITDDDLEKEYELRGLVPVDAYALAAVNEADPAFADDYPNGTHWQDANDNWYYAAFDRWIDARDVVIRLHNFAWSHKWWFGGIYQ